VSSEDPKKPFNNPFGGLAGLKDSLPEGKKPLAKDPKRPPKAVLRLERAGRGGKEVTVVSNLELPVDQREMWLKEMKSGLGCGGHIEGDALVLNGDQRERGAKWLESRVTKVVVGN
jgi:translation initiation factor 1